MAVSDFTEEVEVKVFRSSVKIPVIFLVPVIMLASFYCVVYFYLNSNMFLEELPGLLHRLFPGSFQVRELVVEPSMTSVHLFGSKIRQKGPRLDTADLFVDRASGLRQGDRQPGARAAGVRRRRGDEPVEGAGGR